MFSIRELMDTCFIPQGRYALRILAPKGTPEHRITFLLKDGVYRAEVETEHGQQKANGLAVNGKTVVWQQLGGTPGTELFQYEMEIFPGGFLMGKCWRIDVPVEEAPPSPVIAERYET